MNVLLVIDSFKGSLTSREAEEAARLGVLSVCPDAGVVMLPASDGGEGMLEAFTSAIGGTLVRVTVHDPLMRPIEASFGLSADGRTAVIESAQASGLTLLRPEERNPLLASSYGTGELVRAAAERGCTRLVIGLGGSATSDAGKGMLEALGMKITDSSVDTSSFLFSRQQYASVEVIVASDVLNPLCGPQGAACVFAPQKGATPAMVKELDARALRFAALTASHTGNDLSSAPGAGAAGGLGFALMSYLGAVVCQGADLFLDLADFDGRLSALCGQPPALVITGEGRADRQTLMGKLPFRVMQRARSRGLPVVLLAGQIDDPQLFLSSGFDAAVCINAEGAEETAMLPSVASANVTAAVAAYCRQLTA